MLKYGSKKFRYENLHPLNIDCQSLFNIPSESSVLEIGCATGLMGEYLIKEKGCYVVGVEQRSDEAKQAIKRLNKVIQGNIEEKNILDKLGKFDVVFASAIIEHLKDPKEALRNWKKLIKKNGFLIITTSNITHWSIRAKMLKGNFEYEDYGILDNTHLHFYNIKTFKKLVETSGYSIEKFSTDCVGGGYPKISNFLGKFFPNLFAYQMLIVAKPNTRTYPNKNNPNESE